MGYEEKLANTALKIKRVIDITPNVYNIYVIAFITCISGMMFGFDISSMSAFIGEDYYNNYFFPNGVSANMQGFITASMSLGSFFGSIASTFASEPFGRRFTLLICAFFWLVGAAVQSSAQNQGQLIAGRLIAGIGIGFGSSVAPVLGAELAPRKIRGLIGGIFQLSVTIGILIMFYVSFGFGHLKSVGAFRLAWAMQLIPGLVLFFGVFFVPESPRWLAKRGYWEEAEEIVARIQAKGDRNDPEVQIEISEIKEQILIDEGNKSFGYRDLISKKYRMRTFTAVMAQVWQQMTGMNVMMYYIVYIFSMAGKEKNANLVASSIQYVLNTGMTLPALYFIDKLGRRKVLIFGALSMCLWQSVVAGVLGGVSVPKYISETVRIQIENNPSAANAVIAACYLFVCSFASTWGVGIWVYCSEVWGDSASRQRGASVSTAANWIVNFAIAMYTPASFKNLTWKTYIIYAVACLVMAIHVYFGFPETKAKRLEEIGQMWDEGVPAWKSASWQPSIPVLSDAELVTKMQTQHNENDLLQSSSTDEQSRAEKV